jgi:hypothetical protein
MNNSIKSHGNYKHGLTEHPLYNVWSSMKHRCKPLGTSVTENHGDRGIRVCNEWYKFLPFYEWSINNGYKKGLTLDRINNDRDYDPSNCRYTTYSTQNFNRRKFVRMKRPYQ